MTALVRRSALVLVLALTLGLSAIVAACGGDDEKEADLPPPAETPLQWANRAVDWFLRDISRDLTVLDRLRSPQAFIFLASGEPETLKVVRSRIGDLGRCEEKLEAVGRPPNLQDRPAITKPLLKMHEHWAEACTHYERVSELTLDAVELFESGAQDDHERGVRVFQELKEPTRLGAVAYQRGLDLAVKHPAMRLAGVRPPG